VRTVGEGRELTGRVSASLHREWFGGQDKLKGGWVDLRGM